MNTEESPRWNTKDEINFIKKIGTHYNKERNCPEIPKIVLLNKYLAANRKRSRWGDLNKVEILSACELEIQKINEK